MDDSYTDPVIDQRDALRYGFDWRALSQMVGLGAFNRLRRGSYQIGGPLLRSEDQHRLLVKAAARRFRGTGSLAVSHNSAAVLWGLPTWGVDLSRVHVTRPARSGCSSSTEVVPHRSTLTDDELTEIDGISVTTLARTVLDIARYHGFERGVVAADAALGMGLDRDELTAVVGRAAGRRSAGAANRVIDFADGRSESVGESRSRVALAVLGLPDPELQHSVFDAVGDLLARVDFWWEQFGVVGEFDGMTKYGLEGDPGEVLAREKEREDRLRELGLLIVRWTWSDLREPEKIVARILRAIARAGHPDWIPSPRSGLLIPGTARTGRR